MRSVRKIILLVEVFPVAAVAINPQATQMMVAESQAANAPQETVMRKIIAFAQAAATVVGETVASMIAERVCSGAADSAAHRLLTKRR